MDFGERTTGTRDEHYNLISVLYHALHGAENCDHYASDAEISGDERLAAFFREAQGMQTVLAERAKGMLGIGATSTTSSGGGFGVAGGSEPGFDVGPGPIPGGEALDEIDGWRLWLEGSGDPELLPIAEELGQLGNLLRSGNADPAEVGRILGSLGERLRGLASSDVAAPVADKLRILGGLLNTAGREMPG
jgi:hypothetical protein